MKITDIRHITVPIESEMANAFINFSKMDVSVIAIETDEFRDGKRVVGYGFNSNGRYAQPGILSHRIIPRVLEAEPSSLISPETDMLDPELIWKAAMTNEKPGGHGDRAVAVGILDMASWDLAAKLAGKPVQNLMAESPGVGRGTPLDKVWVYAAGGYYYPGQGVESLQKEMLRYVDMGYRTVKMKIGGVPLEQDIQRIEAVLEVLPAGVTLAVDANGRFTGAEAVRYGQALSSYSLHWYEEPTDPLDFEGLSLVAESYKGVLATGENLLSRGEAMNLVLYGGMRENQDVLQMDSALSYGFTEYRKTLADIAERGWTAERCVPHGGHQFNLAIAAACGLGGSESYPGIFEPFGGFADGIDVVDGYVGLPSSPGIGLEEKSSLRPISISWPSSCLSSACTVEVMMWR